MLRECFFRYFLAIISLDKENVAFLFIPCILSFGYHSIPLQLAQAVVRPLSMSHPDHKLALPNGHNMASTGWAQRQLGIRNDDYADEGAVTLRGTARLSSLAGHIDDVNMTKGTGVVISLDETCI